MVSVLSFSTTPIHCEYGRVKVGDLEVGVGVAGVPIANKNFFRWPGNPGSITVSDDQVFGYFISQSPQDYLGLFEVSSKLVYLTNSNGIMPTLGRLPSEWGSVLYSYLSPLKFYGNSVGDIKFRVTDITRVVVSGFNGPENFILTIDTTSGARIVHDESRIKDISPDEWSHFLKTGGGYGVL